MNKEIKTEIDCEKFLQSILNQRNLLIKNSLSKKNKVTCLNSIKNLQLQIDAYKSKWNFEGWCKFAKRNVSELIYLIPGNKQGLTIENKLLILIKNV